MSDADLHHKVTALQGMLQESHQQLARVTRSYEHCIGILGLMHQGLPLIAAAIRSNIKDIEAMEGVHLNLLTRQTMMLDTAEMLVNAVVPAQGEG